MWLTLATLVVIADYTTTIFAAARWGKGVESNPLWRTLMRHLGLVGFSVIYAGWWAGFITLVHLHYPQLLFILPTIGSVAVANNSFWIVKGLRAEGRL